MCHGDLHRPSHCQLKHVRQRCAAANRGENLKHIDSGGKKLARERNKRAEQMANEERDSHEEKTEAGGRGRGGNEKWFELLLAEISGAALNFCWSGPTMAA